MKAVISNRIYLKCDADEQARLRAHLTYKIPKFIMGKHTFETVRLWSNVNKDIISIPSGRLDLIEGVELVDKRIYEKVLWPEFQCTLRPDQQEIFDLVDSSCIINAQPSWGKTFTGIAIARKLGLKTLIVTHTIFLREQWENEIKKTLGFEPSVIGSGRMEHDTPITVSNIQTLTNRFDKLTKEFGTLIVDEAHHTPASTFIKIVDNSKAKYKIGLTGTMERKDGYHVLLPDVFSPVVHKPAVANTMTPEVISVNTGIYFSSDAAIPWADRVSQLLDNDNYVSLMFDIVQTQVEKGHKVLVLSDRTSILKLGARTLDNAQLVVGSTSSAVRNNLEHELVHGGLDIIFGNMTIFKEGISIPPLSCVVLVTPINNDPLLEQIVGRICRLYPNKLTPQVIDPKLEGPTARKQYTARMGFYLRKGWRIITVGG